MKWRNQLIALFCLLLFVALGVVYFKNWVVQKPFGIILFIGEGLDPTRLAVARIYASGAQRPLHLDALNYSALLKTYGSDAATPDQAAAASALATGAKVPNGSLGVDATGKALANLMELAHQSGRMTGLVTDVRLTEPTAASFYAHTTEKDDRQKIAQELAESGQIDILLGGGGADFLPPAKGGTRTDERDLLQEMADAGYDMVQNLDDLEDLPRWRRAKAVGIFAAGEMAFADDDEARPVQPTLPDMVRRAIELLQFNREGYFLVVDAGLMRRAAQRNDAERTLGQLLELDRAVGVALEYTGSKSAIFVTGDVGLGGMSLNGFPPRDRSGAVWLGSGGDASLTWATGPNGPPLVRLVPEAIVAPSPEATDESSALQLGPNPPKLRSQPAAIFQELAAPTATDVLVLGNGLGAEDLHGIMENTHLFEIIQDDL